MCYDLRCALMSAHTVLSPACHTDNGTLLQMDSMPIMKACAIPCDWHQAWQGLHVVVSHVVHRGLPALARSSTKNVHEQSFILFAPSACLSMCGFGVLADVKLQSEAVLSDVKTSVQTVAVQVPKA